MGSSNTADIFSTKSYSEGDLVLKKNVTLKNIHMIKLSLTTKALGLYKLQMKNNNTSHYYGIGIF